MILRITFVLSLFILFSAFVSSCSPSRRAQSPFIYSGGSSIGYMQDISFLDIPGKSFKKSRVQITFCIANPYTCTTKFFFINKNRENKWEGCSYRYNRCWQDSVNIEKVKIKLDDKWDSVFSILLSENLFYLPNQNKMVDELEKQAIEKKKIILLRYEGDINYSFYFKINNKISHTEINRIEMYRDYYAENELDVSNIKKLIRLKELFAVVLDFDTDFRFKK